MLKNFSAHTLAVRTLWFLSVLLLFVSFGMFRRKKEKNVEMYCRNLNRGIASARRYGSIMILSSFLFSYLST